MYRHIVVSEYRRWRIDVSPCRRISAVYRHTGVSAHGRIGISAYRRAGIPAYWRINVSAGRRIGVSAHRRPGLSAPALKSCVINLGQCGGDGAPQNKLSWCDGVGAGAGPAGQAGPVRHAKPVGPIKTAGPAEPVVCVGTVRPARTTGHADSKKRTCRICQTRHNRRIRR